MQGHSSASSFRSQDAAEVSSADENKNVARVSPLGPVYFLRRPVTVRPSLRRGALESEPFVVVAH